MDWKGMTDPGFEERVKALGFRDGDQLKRMVLDVDLPDPVIFGMFYKWKRGPMTRERLQNILDFQRGRDDGLKMKERD